MAVPTDVAGLSVWYKADAITGLSDGNDIVAWPDSSDNGYVTSNSGSNRPNYETGEINALPVARFASFDALVSSAPSSLTTTTLFAVVRPTTISGVQTIRGGSSGVLQFELNAGKVALIKQAQAVIGTGNTAVSTVNYSVVAGVFTSGTSWAVYLNGNADGGSSTSQTLTAGGTTTIGGRDSAGAEPLIGDLAELIVYNSVLSSTDRNAITSYLGTKYAISVAGGTAAGPVPLDTRFRRIRPLLVR